MSTRVEPELRTELTAYGAVGIERCFNCGNCTAICPLAATGHSFPRNMIRLVQIGNKARLQASLDPWLCYYCGECAATCPRGAEPGETMMALRRWLTAQYDASGQAARLYTSARSVWLIVARSAALTLLFFLGLHFFGLAQVVTDRVALNSFAPVGLIWAMVLLHGAYLGIRVLTNASRMFRWTMEPLREDDKIPLSACLAELRTLIVEFFTQKRWRGCGIDLTREALRHMFMASGYILMLVLVVGLLGWFQTDHLYPLSHPQRWLGYYATIVLVYGSLGALLGRRRRNKQMHRFSHHTDWFFPAFILIGSITGILVHFFRYAGWAWATYATYVLHLIVVLAMLDSEVGVGKWSHLIYRPFAVYLDAVKARARQKAGTAQALAHAK